METMTCLLVHAMPSPSSSRVWAIDLPMGAPHVIVGGVGIEGSFLWTRIAQGFVGRLGRPGNAW